MTKKKSKLTKVAEETKIPEADLALLPEADLDKLDALTPDTEDDVLLGGDEPELPTVSGSDQTAVQVPGDASVDSSGHAGQPTLDDTIPGASTTVLTPESPSEKLPVEPQTTPTDVPEAAPDVHARVMIGFHPVTEEPVYQ